MNYKTMKRKLIAAEGMRDYYKEMIDLHKEIGQAGIGELRFSKMQTQYLESVLDEILAFTTDHIAKAVIENTKNRHELDKLIHTRDLFGEKPQGLNDK